MTRISSLIAAIADAALTVAIGLGVPLLATVASWLITGGFQTTHFELPFTTAAAIWALGLGGGVAFTIDPATYPGLGIAEPFSFVVSVAPLAVTAFIAWMGWRAGNRLADDDAPWSGMLGSTAAFAIVAWLSTAFATFEGVRIDVTGAVLVGTLTWLVMLAIGTRIWEYLPWQHWLGDRLDTITDTAIRAVRIATGLVAGVFALASLLLIVALVTSMGRVIGLMESLQLDIPGVIAVGAMQLAYLPTLLIWAASWVLGPGIQLGTGSAAGLGGVDAGPLPVLPLLGLIPESASPLWWGMIALPVLLAAVIALIARARNEDIDSQSWWERLLPPGLGALLAAVTLAVLAQLSRGSLGPGRLTEFGPQPGWVLLAALALFLVGGAVGAFLPLESVSGLEPATAEVDADEPHARKKQPGSESRFKRAQRAAAAGSGGTQRAAEPEAQDFDDADPDPKTAPHLIHFHNVIGRILGESRHDDEDDAEPDSQRDSKTAPNAAPRSAPNATVRDSEDAHPEEARPDPETPAKENAAERRPPSPYQRPVKRTELRDAVQRPDEPDIYADIDLDADR
ncbi:MAG: cell division protein PerM [Gulosibacter sp.]|uniref:cell division protein PerM n=1 Tax=Gulosibacter sp. TaxID=2817531 RepID=UPI003F920509